MVRRQLTGGLCPIFRGALKLCNCCTTNILNMTITSVLLHPAGLLRSFAKALSSSGRNSSHGMAALRRSREGFFLASFASLSSSSYKPCWPTMT